jgi:hypothetical protein
MPYDAAKVSLLVARSRIVRCSATAGLARDGRMSSIMLATSKIGEIVGLSICRATMYLLE